MHSLFSDLVLDIDSMKVFYNFLVDSFRDSPGSALVLSKRFMVMNGYNNLAISADSWRTSIQPKSKVTMTMVLAGLEVRQGRCVDPTCSGRVDIRPKSAVRTW
jgi:hypothetical protein